MDRESKLAIRHINLGWPDGGILDKLIGLRTHRPLSDPTTFPVKLKGFHYIRGASINYEIP